MNLKALLPAPRVRHRHRHRGSRSRKALGIRTELAIHPHEGHEFSAPAHVLDRIQRTVNWFDENTPSGADAITKP